MNVFRYFRDIVQFFKLGLAEGLEDKRPEEAQCLQQNQDAFRRDILIEAGPHADDVPPEDASPEGAYLHLKGAIERRIYELFQLFHQNGYRLYSTLEKHMAHLLIFLLVSFETAIARPALRDVFHDLSHSASIGYVGALVLGLTIMIHVAGTTWKSRRYSVTVFALFIVLVTNALLITVRAIAFNGTEPIIVGLFSCVAVMVTASSLWITYRMATNDRIMGPPSVNLELLEAEVKIENRTLKRIRQSYSRYKSKKRAFYQGYYVQQIRRTAAMKFLKLGLFWQFVLVFAPDASAFEVQLDAQPHFTQLGSGPITLRLSVDANDPERFINSLTGSRIHLSGPGISEAFHLKSTEDVKTWSWMPTRPGNYRIRFSALTRGDYPIVATTEVDVAEPGNGFSTPIDVEFVPGAEFEVRIPVPDIPYPKLDFRIVQDISGSMSDEIADVQASNQAIFRHLSEFSSAPMVSVMTFSDVRENVTRQLEPVNFTMALQPTNDPNSLANLRVATGGGNEATYFALRYAADLGLFREDSLKFLLLVTDEADNIYADNPDLQREWHPQGTLSPRSILTDLQNRGFCVGVVFSGMSNEQVAIAYGNLMNEILGTRFAGVLPLSSSSTDTAQRVARRIRDALEKLAGQTIFTLELDRAENAKWIQSITPSQPASCVDSNGFQMGRLREAGAHELVFKVRLTKSAPQTPQRFFLLGTSDKGTRNHTVPVIIRN